VLSSAWRFGLLSRGRFSFRHFLYSCGLGIVGSGATLAALAGMQTAVSRNVNGLLAELFGAETSVGDLLLLVGPALIALSGCVVMTFIAHRESRVRA
jgi:hypothetical protein